MTTARLMIVSVLLASNLHGCASKKSAGNTSAPLDAATGIGMDRAHAIALEAAPGKLVEAERELEDGRDIYSVEIDPQDGSGNLREVHVDAITGEVVRVETETPEDEKREREHDDDEHDGDAHDDDEDEHE